MSYGADDEDLYRRTAVDVDNILKGAKPPDLPMQQAPMLELVINVKSAILLGAMLFALCFPAQAQQPKEMPRIGWLRAGSSTRQLPRTEAFRRGLRELGYVEGKNILIEYRHAEVKYDRLPVLAAELVRLKVDVIVTGGG